MSCMRSGLMLRHITHRNHVMLTFVIVFKSSLTPRGVFVRMAITPMARVTSRLNVMLCPTCFMEVFAVYGVHFEGIKMSAG